MKQTIEDTWKAGSIELENDHLPAKRNYHKMNSKLSIDKLLKATKLDNSALLVIIVLAGITLFFLKELIVAAYCSLLLSMLYVSNRKRIKALESIKIENDNYTYLKSFHENMQVTIRFYTRLMTFGFPLFVIPVLPWLILGKTKVLKILSENSWSKTALTILIVYAALSICGFLAYRLSVKIGYSRLISKIEDNLEALKQLNTLPNG